jgi:hypothetical protein
MKPGWLGPVLLLVALSALAEDAGVLPSAWLGASAVGFDYEEFDDQGNSLDREEGGLPGIQAGLRLAAAPWFAEGSLWWTAGTADYSSPRHQTTTDEDFKGLEVLIGRRLWVSDRQRASLLLGGGYRQWQRNIRSTDTATGLDETYRWAYGLLGLRGTHEVKHDLRLVAEIQLTRTFDPDVKVDFGGLFDEMRLALGEETGLRASLALDWRFGHATTLRLSPWYESWEFGRSDDRDLYRNGILVGTVYEPRSETHHAGVTLSLMWRFDPS